MIATTTSYFPNRLPFLSTFCLNAFIYLTTVKCLSSKSIALKMNLVLQKLLDLKNTSNIVISAITRTSKQICELDENFNKTRTSKVGAISKAQKAPNIFLEKKLEIFENFSSLEKCRLVPKNVKGEILLDLLTYILLQYIKKPLGDLLGTLKNFRKKVAVPKKIQRGPVRHVRFCRFP